MRQTFVLLLVLFLVFADCAKIRGSKSRPSSHSRPSHSRPSNSRPSYPSYPSYPAYPSPSVSRPSPAPAPRPAPSPSAPLRSPNKPAAPPVGFKPGQPSHLGPSAPPYPPPSSPNKLHPPAPGFKPSVTQPAHHGGIKKDNVKHVQSGYKPSAPTYPSSNFNKPPVLLSQGIMGLKPSAPLYPPPSSNKFQPPVPGFKPSFTQPGHHGNIKNGNIKNVPSGLNPSAPPYPPPSSNKFQPPTPGFKPSFTQPGHHGDIKKDTVSNVQSGRNPSAPPYPPPSTNKFQPPPPAPGFVPGGVGGSHAQPPGPGFKPNLPPGSQAPHYPGGAQPISPNYRPPSYVPPPSYHGHPSPPAHPPAYHPPPQYYNQNGYRPQPPPPPGYYGGSPSHYAPHHTVGGYPTSFPSPGGVTIINNYGGGGGGFGGGGFGGFGGGGFGGYGGGYGSSGGSGIGKALIGAYVGYKIGQWTSDISHRSYHNSPYTTSWGEPRPTSYTVHHYHHDADVIPKKAEVSANTLVFCEGSSMCAKGTNPICMSNGTIMCLGPPQKIEPCADNATLNCVKATIECYDTTDPKCSKETNTTVVDMPCISTVNISGTLNTTALALQQQAVQESLKNETANLNATDTANANNNNATELVNGTLNFNGTIDANGTVSLNTTLLQDININLLTSTPNFCVTVVALPANKTTEEKYWADYYKSYYDNYVNNIVNHTSFWLEKAFVNLWSPNKLT